MKNKRMRVKPGTDITGHEPKRCEPSRRGKPSQRTAQGKSHVETWEVLEANRTGASVEGGLPCPAPFKPAVRLERRSLEQELAAALAS